MSNSYLQFCEALELKNDEEARWFRRYMDAMNPAFDSKNWDRDTGGFTPLTPEATFWRGVFDDTGDDAAFFECKLTTLDGKDCFLVYVEDQGCVDHAAKLIQHFLKEMRPEGKDGFSISWAETCDKMQPGQFGGGACFITKSEIHWLNTWQWLTDLAQQLHVE